MYIWLLALLCADPQLARLLISDSKTPTRACQAGTGQGGGSASIEQGTVSLFSCKPALGLLSVNYCRQAGSS